MTRNVTAVYRTHATADLVRRELEQFGISRGYIHVLPDDARDAALGINMGGTATGATSASGASEYAHEGVPNTALMDAVDDLQLPDEDTRTYKHSLQRGDHLVSVEADDDQVARVITIMRRPEAEAHNLDMSDEEFRGAADFPRREGYVVDEDRFARRDPELVDPYTRSYERRTRLDERISR